MRKVFQASALLAALVLVSVSSISAGNQQSYAKPTNVTASDTAEGHVLVTWNADGAPVHRVGWAHDADGRAASAAGDWLEAFHFVDTRRNADYTVKYLPDGQKYWFVVGATSQRFSPATWSDWTSLIMGGSPSVGQPTTGPTPVEEDGDLVADHLVVVLDPPSLQSMLDCEVTVSGLVNYRMSAEFLVDANRHTGEYEPMLATEWSLTPDGRTWNFKLRRGVRWHDNWGTFTARDVAHSMAYYTNPECWASYSDYFRTDPGSEVEIVNDYEVNMHMQRRPALDFIYWLSGYRGLPISSKAQWDQRCPNGAGDYGTAQGGEQLGYCKASRDAVYAKSARTGPYEYVNFDENRSVWDWRRVDYNHWRIRPDFGEITIHGIREPATRLAVLLAGQGHVGHLGRALLVDAVGGGLEALDSSKSADTTFAIFGGMYFSTGSKGVPMDVSAAEQAAIRDSYDIAAARDEMMPWNAPGPNGRKVRMAMNKAIDREAINEVIFYGFGGRQWVAALSPDFPVGYHRKWEADWQELYGYDPERARELLTEAGYPDGFAVQIPVYSLSGVPEMPDVMQAIAAFWADIGIEPSMSPVEFSAWRNQYRGLNTDCCIYPLRGPSAPIDTSAHFYYSAERFSRAYTSDDIQENKNLALRATNASRATALWQNVADEIFYEVGTIPGWTLSAHAVVDPDIVDEYSFLGPNHGTYIYLEYVKGVRK